MSDGYGGPSRAAPGRSAPRRRRRCPHEARDSSHQALPSSTTSRRRCRPSESRVGPSRRSPDTAGRAGTEVYRGAEYTGTRSRSSGSEIVVDDEDAADVVNLIVRSPPPPARSETARSGRSRRRPGPGSNRGTRFGRPLESAPRWSRRGRRFRRPSEQSLGRDIECRRFDGRDRSIPGGHADRVVGRFGKTDTHTRRGSMTVTVDTAGPEALPRGA